MSKDTYKRSREIDNRIQDLLTVNWSTLTDEEISYREREIDRLNAERKVEKLKINHVWDVENFEYRKRRRNTERFLKELENR